ncbi:hypothetical protein SBDP1_520035 [Syntrophobacter sp. SbD1]|nr:hypothetical protein SBDP1_520035 [Syntrophobacter sp. SbD1]
MESGLKTNEILSKLPARFYERIIRDIPSSAWVLILTSDPILKKVVLEGFSLQPAKFSRMVLQPPIMNRLRRELQTNEKFFEKILAQWKEEQTAVVSYLGMLDSDFIAQNIWKLRDLLGPERFCIGLCALGLQAVQRVAETVVEEDFWSKLPDADLFELLVPTLTVWGEFIEKHPGLSADFLQSQEGNSFLFDIEGGQTEQEKPGAESKEPFKKVEKKLKKAQLDLVHIGEQLSGARGENEDLRKRIKGYETEFEKKLADAVSRIRREWFERYQHFDREGAVKEAERLESLLQRTRRALELQKKADEEYGVISDIRAKLLEIDLSLNRIEAVYADSLVVHKEVEKVKEALLTEKSRLSKLPGIRKVLGTPHGNGGDIVARINLLDPIPANLPKMNNLRKMAQSLCEIGLVSDTAQLEEAVRHKRRQILERLYSKFEPERRKRAPDPRFLEDFISSGQSRRYELFIDGYNVLLRVQEGDEHSLRPGFTQFREQFIEAVAAKGKYFAKVYLVFDGVEDSRDLQANTEIIYTDKTRRSADAVIIERIAARKDKKVLLVTADEGIISVVEDRIFALVDVVDFYMYLFEQPK